MSETCKIMLTRAMFAIVDAEDFKTLSRFRWCVLAARDGTRFYAVRRHRNRFIFMHRVIANAPDGIDVDHINGNRLDNRRCNLRLCTRSENLRNRGSRHGSSQFKGVYRNKRDQIWQAYITVNKKRLHLGCFGDEFAAAAAYDAAARKHFGDFARLNFPPNPQTEK
jgi:hypothetical protein